MLGTVHPPLFTAVEMLIGLMNLTGLVLASSVFFAIYGGITGALTSNHGNSTNGFGTVGIAVALLTLSTVLPMYVLLLLKVSF